MAKRNLVIWLSALDMMVELGCEFGRSKVRLADVEAALETKLMTRGKLNLNCTGRTSWPRLILTDKLDEGVYESL